MTKFEKIDEKWTQIEIMDLGSGVIKLRENSEKIAIFHPIPTQKWDKNKNNGFGLGPQILIIKLANFLRKSMKNQ